MENNADAFLEEMECEEVEVVEAKQPRIKSEDEIDEEMENRGIPSNLTPEEEEAIDKISL